MENVLVKNEMTEKEIDFTDFISFVHYTAIECAEDLGFTSAEAFRNGSCFNEDDEEQLFKYATGEEAWITLEKLIGGDIFDMEDKFKCCKWEDNENTAIITFLDDTQYAILRM